MSASADIIEIRKLRVSARVGVPDEEIAAAQTLEVSVVMTPQGYFDDLADDISRTVDYHAVSMEIQSIAKERPRRLIETLAIDLADILLKNHALRRIEVLVEKFILPETECVAVRVVRVRC